MHMVEVFSSQLVTKDNKNGKGTIDLDTQEGEKIFGGKTAVAKYKADMLVAERMRLNAETEAIIELKAEEKIPADYIKVG